MRMKILISGDWHIRAKKPVNRKDTDYFNSISDKIKQEFEAAKEHDVNFILQPGDVFDTHAVSDRIVRRVVKLFNDCPVPLMTVPGQHDLKFHSKIWENTPIGILDATEHGLRVMPYSKFDMGQINIYGAGWGIDIPEPENPKAFNILLCHKLIVDTKHWKGNFSYEYDGTDLLRNHNYDLIVSGDNHQTFTCEHDGKTLINAGSLMRTRIDQVDHLPCYFIYDTGTKEYTTHLLKVQKIDDILDLDKAQKEKEKNADLIDFVNRVEEETGADDEELNFRKKLATRIERQKKKIGAGIVNVLKEVMSENDETH